MLTQAEKNLIWYQNGFEVFNPLRYHLYNLIEELEKIDLITTELHIPIVSKRKLKEAKEALDAAELFCTRPIL